ncbi:MAG: hypothetical protein IPO75_13885 [Betaproteobacteria bacterium]|nr:hypothetical protein [Betaproteobacteria bacterium]
MTGIARDGAQRGISRMTSARAGRAGDGRRGIERCDHRPQHRRESALQRPVVLAVVGQQEVAPDQPIDDLGRRERRRVGAQQRRQLVEAAGKPRTRVPNRLGVGRHHRQ